MTITSLMPQPKLQFLTALGTPLVGGKIYTYAAGTTTPKDTFTDSAGTTKQPNPIPLNLRGEPASAIFWSGSYRVELRDAFDNLIYSVDNYTDPGSIVNAALIGLQLADYAALRAYTGTQTMVYVTGFLATAAPSGIAGNFIRDDSDHANADNGGTIIVDGSGRRWKRVYTERVNALWFGAKGDGATDDTVAIQAAVNVGNAFLPKTTLGYKTTATLYIDNSLTSLHSDGANINSSVPQGSPTVMVFSSADYGADGKAPYTKNYVRVACLGFALIGTRQGSAPAGGTGYIGFQIGRAGSAYFQSGDIEVQHCAVFGFDTQVLFSDNAWRTKFKECSFSAGSYPIWFSNPSNAGEVMTFEGCWIVGWTNTLLINAGYFVFYRCSMFGTATGIVVTQNSAYVVLSDTNVEVANDRANILFSVETTSRLTMRGGSIVFDGNMASPAFQGDTSYSMITFEGVSLPLYGENFNYEVNAYGDNQIRGLVRRGFNTIVRASDCFPKAGVLATRADIQAIIGCHNMLSNGDGSRGDLRPWTQSIGAVCSVSNVSPRNGSNCFNVGSGLMYQDINVAANPGRWFVMAFWAKPLAGNGTLGNPKVTFFDSGLITIAEFTVHSVTSAETGWRWYAFNWPKPEGASIARIVLDAGAIAGASIAFDDVYFDIY